MALVPLFDLDGTLLDSDAPLAGAFVALGVAPEDVTYGHVVADECRRLGLELDDYLDAYDTAAAQPFAGVEDLLATLDRWGIASNKADRSGRAELARLGWRPETALFADAFDGPKALGPLLAAMDLAASEVVFVGDTGHDRRCATDVGARFALAAWNPRARPEAGDLVLERPGDLLELL